MSYTTKNYNDQGGDLLHIGGTLEFGDGAKVEGFPGAVNQAKSTATSVADLKGDLNALLTNLKDAGLMTGDAWNVSIAGPLSNLPTEADTTNAGHATITIEDNVITVALDCKVSELADADHGSTWGTHKWIPMGINTGLASIIGVIFSDGTSTVTLGEDDVAEATGLGLSAGKFVLYIKAEKIFAQGGEFTLSGLGMKKTAFKLVVTES